MAKRYPDNVVENAPPWLQRPNGTAFLRAFGSQKDWVADRARDAVRARFPGAALDRTNLIPYSEPLLANVPTKTGTVTQGALTDLGLSNGITFPAAVQADYAYFTITVFGPIWLSVFVKMADGTAPALSGVNSSGDLGLVTEGILLNQSLKVEQVAGSLYRLSGYLVATGVAGNVGVVRYATQSGKGFTVTGYHLEAAANGPTSYIKTSGAPATMSSLVEGSAPSDAIPLIGAERGLARGIAESEGRYRARLAAALEAWKWAGTPYGLLRAMQIAGYPSVLLQQQSGKQYTLAGSAGTEADLSASSMPAPVHLGGAPQELWSDISLLITKPWPTWWNNVAPADGSSDCLTVKALILAWKGAWNRCVKLNVVTGPVWGGFTWGAFTWGSGSVTVWTPPVG